MSEPGRNLLNYVTVLPITLDIAIASPALALPHGDQFDRIITATAKVHRLSLVTKDANITHASVVSTVWCPPTRIRHYALRLVGLSPSREPVGKPPMAYLKEELLV